MEVVHIKKLDAPPHGENVTEPELRQMARTTVEALHERSRWVNGPAAPAEGAELRAKPNLIPEDRLADLISDVFMCVTVIARV